MVFRFATWLLNLLRREKFDIGRFGGGPLNVYMTRWTLVGQRFGADGKNRVFLHYFHRSDLDEAMHDHPWSFWSLILWGGYYEITAQGRKWHGPLSLLKRPPEFAHRVELHPGTNAWTLVWTGPKVRSWGFYCPGGWKPWRDFMTNYDAGTPGCGDNTPDPVPEPSHAVTAGPISPDGTQKFYNSWTMAEDKNTMRVSDAEIEEWIELHERDNLAAVNLRSSEFGNMCEEVLYLRGSSKAAWDNEKVFQKMLAENSNAIWTAARVVGLDTTEDGCGREDAPAVVKAMVEEIVKLRAELSAVSASGVPPIVVGCPDPNAHHS